MHGSYLEDFTMNNRLDGAAYVFFFASLPQMISGPRPPDLGSDAWTATCSHFCSDPTIIQGECPLLGRTHEYANRHRTRCEATDRTCWLHWIMEKATDDLTMWEMFFWAEASKMPLTVRFEFCYRCYRLWRSLGYQ